MTGDRSLSRQAGLCSGRCGGGQVGSTQWRRRRMYPAHLRRPVPPFRIAAKPLAAPEYDTPRAWAQQLNGDKWSTPGHQRTSVGHRLLLLRVSPSCSCPFRVFAYSIRPWAFITVASRDDESSLRFSTGSFHQGYGSAKKFWFQSSSRAHLYLFRPHGTAGAEARSARELQFFLSLWVSAERPTTPLSTLGR